MSDNDGDTVIILSSELIAEVMEAHFNKKMFKQQVKVVDLKPTETGYMFSLAFVPAVQQNTVPKRKAQPKQMVKSFDIDNKGAEQFKQYLEAMKDTTVGPIEQWSEQVDRDFRNGVRDSKGRFAPVKVKE